MLLKSPYANAEEGSKALGLSPDNSKCNNSKADISFGRNKSKGFHSTENPDDGETHSTIVDSPL